MQEEGEKMMVETMVETMEKTKQDRCRGKQASRPASLPSSQHLPIRIWCRGGGPTSTGGGPAAQNLHQERCKADVHGGNEPGSQQASQPACHYLVLLRSNLISIAVDVFALMHSYLGSTLVQFACCYKNIVINYS